MALEVQTDVSVLALNRDVLLSVTLHGNICPQQTLENMKANSDCISYIASHETGIYCAVLSSALVRGYNKNPTYNGVVVWVFTGSSL